LSRLWGHFVPWAGRRALRGGGLGLCGLGFRCRSPERTAHLEGLRGRFLAPRTHARAAGGARSMPRWTGCSPESRCSPECWCSSGLGALRVLVLGGPRCSCGSRCRAGCRGVRAQGRRGSRRLAPRFVWPQGLSATGVCLAVGFV
jgi:hypothetical protein